MKSLLSHLLVRDHSSLRCSALPVSCLRTKVLGVLGLASLLVTSSAVGYQYTTFSTLEAVKSDGSSDYTGTTAVSLIGVVINNPCDMSNHSNFYINPSDASDATWWQTFIQALPGSTYDGIALDANDHGGAALYIRANNPWAPSAPKYDATTWQTEMNRVNCVSGSTTLQYGDVIKVTTDTLGVFYNGKLNINEHHSAAPAYDFTVEILDHITPVAAEIDLSLLKDDTDNFIFEQDRDSGCEFYQGSLVHLTGLTIVDPSKWTLDNRYDPITVQQRGEDGVLRTFDLVLGLDSALDIGMAQAELLKTTPFSVTAILNQEDPNNTSSPGFDDGYQLWLTNASNLSTVSEPSSLVLSTLAAMAGLLAWRRRSGKSDAAVRHTN